MTDIVETLLETNIPTIVTLVGLLLLFLSIAGRFGTYVEIREDRQKTAAYIGGLLFIVGIGIQFVDASPASTASSSTAFGSSKPSGASDYWIIAGSFSNQTSAKDIRDKLAAAEIQSMVVNSRDYSFLRGDYSVVLVPVNGGKPALASTLEDVRKVVPDAYDRVAN